MKIEFLIFTVALLVLNPAFAGLDKDLPESAECRKKIFDAEYHLRELRYQKNQSKNEAELKVFAENAHVYANLAYDFCLKLAESGNTDGMIRTALMNGGSWGFIAADSIVKDDKVAEMWMIKAAEKGNSFAQKTLIRCYKKGFCGLDKDLEKAEFWREKLLKNTNK